MKKLFLFVFALPVAMALTGCETVKGVGRDITGASDNVEHALNSHK